MNNIALKRQCYVNSSLLSSLPLTDMYLLTNLCRGKGLSVQSVKDWVSD